MIESSIGRKRIPVRLLRRPEPSRRARLADDTLRMVGRSNSRVAPSMSGWSSPAAQEKTTCDRFARRLGHRQFGEHFDGRLRAMTCHSNKVQFDDRENHHKGRPGVRQADRGAGRAAIRACSQVSSDLHSSRAFCRSHGLERLGEGRLQRPVGRRCRASRARRNPIDQPDRRTEVRYIVRDRSTCRAR